MAPAEDSTVRIPKCLLERAESLDPNNRSEIIRRACSLGLLSMERAKERGGAPQLVAAEGEVPFGKHRRVLASFYKVDDLHPEFGALGPGPYAPGSNEELLPVFAVKAGQKVEIVLPPIHWMTYAPVDLKIVHEPGAKVEVSGLRADGGGGRDLLMPGWHGAHEFGGLATALAKREVVSTSDLRMVVTSDRDTVVTVSAVLEVELDSILGTEDRGQRETPAGRLVRLRLEQITADGRFETRPVHWGHLKVRGVVFEGDQASLLRTTFQDLRVHASPDLCSSYGKSSAAVYTGLDHHLRLGVQVRSPGVASLLLGDASRVFAEAHGGLPAEWGEGKQLAVPYLACEVVEDFGDPRR